jgi:hypothetical protein
MNAKEENGLLLRSVRNFEWNDFFDKMIDGEVPKRASGVYMIGENWYIGRSQNIRNRIKQHVYQSIGNYHGTRELGRLIKQHIDCGWLLKIRILSNENSEHEEAKIINEYGPLFNHIRPRFTILFESDHLARKKLGLNIVEMAVLCFVVSDCVKTKSIDYCTKTKDFIADYMDISRDSVYRIIKQLVSLGYIEKKKDGIVVSDAMLRFAKENSKNKQI